MISLKKIYESEFVPPAHWEIHECDMLYDLGFKPDGEFKVKFEFDEEVSGEEKYLEISVYKHKTYWALSCKRNKDYLKQAGDEGNSKPVEEKFSSFTKLINRVHEIFQNE